MRKGTWGRRCALCAAAALVGLATRAAVSDDDAGPTAGSGAAQRRRAAKERIEAVLDAPLKSPLVGAGAPLNQLMQIVAEDNQIPIVFDTAALDAVALSPEVEVSVNLANISLRSAMELTLKSVEDLTWIIDNEVLMITTHDEADKRLEVRVHRVDDLIDGGDFDALIDVIVATVEKSSWAENCTGEGEIHGLAPGMIVVTTTHAIHEQLAEALEAIRQAKAQVVAAGGDAAAASTAAPVTRAVPFAGQSLGDSADMREIVRKTIMHSVAWGAAADAAADNAEHFLYVLPNRVIVRHRPAVVHQVERLVAQLAPPPAVDGGAPAGFFGGRQSRGGGF